MKVLYYYLNVVIALPLLLVVCLTINTWKAVKRTYREVKDSYYENKRYFNR